MDQMQIVIPTRGRVGFQMTLSKLPSELRKRTVIVCPEEEVKKHLELGYLREAAIIGQPDCIKTISQKRAWIMRDWHGQGINKILMLDDDLKFYIRRDDVPDRLRYPTPDEFIHWFGALEHKLSPYVPHAGFGPRQGNNNQDAGWQCPGRMMFSLGYYLPTVLENAELERVRFREDMDVTLQLLRKGFPNEVCHTFVQGQESYAAEGGCSAERDVVGSDEEAEKLAELHPGFVTVKQKDYLGSEKRKEVICYWKKALISSGFTK